MRWLFLVLVCGGCEQLLGISDPHAATGDGGHPGDGTIGDGQAPFDAAKSPDAFGACATSSLAFGAATSYPVTGAESFELADLDNDGDLDLVVATQTDTVFLINDGSGHFGPNRKLVAGEDEPADGVVLGDFDGDQRTDVLRWSNDSPILSLTLHVDTMAASFVDGMTLTLNGVGNVAAAFGGQINADPFADVAVATSSGRTEFVIGGVSGTLTKQLDFSGTVAGFSDADFDHNPDYLFAPALGVGFAPPTVISLGGTGATLGDGFPVAGDTENAIVSVDAAGDVVIHRQTAARTFAPGGLAFSPLPPAPGKLQILDVDGDGRKDIVGLGQVLQSCNAPAPLGQLASTTAALPGGNAVYQRLANLDGNTLPDLVIIDANQANIVVFLQ
jgi:FG-GAP-like repeat